MKVVLLALLCAATTLAENAFFCGLSQVTGNVIDDYVCPGKDPELTLIPSTQRTQNTPGYALSAKYAIGPSPNISDTSDVFHLHLTVQTPILTMRNVIQMYLSFEDSEFSSTA